MHELINKRLEKRSISQRCGDNAGALEKGQSQADAGKVPPKSTTRAPNILLNLRPPSSRNGIELRSFAVFGMFLQAGVLVFSGFTTYHPELLYRKGGLEVVPYAYPLTASGTVILVVGMLICSFVVERSTKEKRWIVNTEAVIVLEEKMEKELKEEIEAVPKGVERGRREMQLNDIKRELNALGKKERRAGILWLQAGGNVNDQVFDSYPIFAHGSRDSVLTSWSTMDPQENGDKSKGVPSTAYQRAIATLDRLSHTLHLRGNVGRPAPNESGFTTPTNFMRTLAVTGTLISITGFVTQFTGLRGMHWSATIAQLIATLTMAIVRAWIRRGLTSRPQADRIPQRHELDWLATRIAKNSGDLWPEDGGDLLGTKSPQVSSDFRSKTCSGLGVKTGAGAGLFSFQQQYHMSGEHQVTRIRDRLGQLSNWTGTLSSHAISVANAIEVVMNTLFSRKRYKGKKRLFWSVQGSAREDPESLIYLSVERGDSGLWTASATEIEAVLSLWLYAIHEFEEEEARADKNDSSFKKDWLRRGDTALRKMNIRLLGLREEGYLRDLHWYASDALMSISEVEEIPGVESDAGPAERSDDPNVQEVLIDRHRVFGFTKHRSAPPNNPLDPSSSPSAPPPRPATSAHQSPAQPLSLPGKRYKVRTIPVAMDESEPAEVDSDASDLRQTTAEQSTPENKKSRRYLAVISDAPLELCLAQDVFSAFMWAAARKTEKLDGKTILNKLDQRDTNTHGSWKHFTLENATLERMAKDIERSGLGGLEDIYLTIVPPLSLNQRLPASLCVVEHAMDVARPYEAGGRWTHAADVYMWLFRTYSDSDGPVALKAFVAFTMFTWTIRNTVRLWRKEMHGPTELATVAALESALLAKAETANKSWISCLQTVSQLQRQSMDETETIFENLSADGPASGTRPRKFQGFPGASSTHRLFLSNKRHIREELHTREKDIIGLTPLHYSVLSKLPHKQTSLLLDAGADPNSTDMLGWTPLHYAATYSDEETILVLLNSRADPTSKDLAGWTPLHAAAWHGNKSACEMLLQQGARLDAQGRDGRGILHYAAIRGHCEIARRLLEFGANVDIHDNLRRTPLHWAVHYGDLDMIELLVGNGANTTVLEANGRTLLHLASMGGWWVDGVFDLIKAREVDVQAKDRLGSTPLHLAAMVGNETASLHLIGRGSNSNTKRSRDEKAPLVGIAANGLSTTKRTRSHHHPDRYVRKVQQLREADQIDVLTRRGSPMEVQDNKGDTPLHEAANHGKEGVIRLLLDHGAQIGASNKEGWTALHIAVWNGKESVVQLLLDRGAAIDASNKEGKTPLHEAARNGEEAVAQLLLDRGAAKDASNKEGLTALHIAVWNWKEAVVQLLLDRGAAIDASNKEGKTPLHEAACNGKEALVQLLLDRGAAVDASDNEGRTPLHEAAGNGKEAVVQLLLDRGAAINASNKKRKTPLHEAAWNGKEAVVQ